MTIYKDTYTIENEEFRRVDTENLALNIATQAIKDLRERKGLLDDWFTIDPELKMEILDDLKNSIKEILEGQTI